MKLRNFIYWLFRKPYRVKRVSKYVSGFGENPKDLKNINVLDSDMFR